jgi:hypothetical protein
VIFEKRQVHIIIIIDITLSYPISIPRFYINIHRNRVGVKRDLCAAFISEHDWNTPTNIPLLIWISPFKLRPSPAHPSTNETMTLKLKRTSKSPPPFSWDALVSSPPAAPELATSLPSPPTSWLSARDMKMFGAQPLKADIGVVKCKDCDKPVLRSAIVEHAGESNTFLSRGRRVAHILSNFLQIIVNSSGLEGRKAQKAKSQM